MTPEDVLRVGTVGQQPPPETPPTKPAASDWASRVYSAADRTQVPKEIADDYLNVTGLAESGNNQYKADGSTLRGPRTKQTGDKAFGGGQVMSDHPGTHVRTINGHQYDLNNPDDNAEAGLLLFHAGGPDPVRRRIGYFGPAGLKHYDRTGQIPSGGDGYTSYAEYVRKTMPKGAKPATPMTADDVLAAGTQGSQLDEDSKIAAAQADVARTGAAVASTRDALLAESRRLAGAGPMSVDDVLAAGTTQNPTNPPGQTEPLTGAAPAEPVTTGTQTPSVAGERPAILTETNRAAITRPRVVGDQKPYPGEQLPQQGGMPGTVHLNPAIAPKVPAGAPRPFAPGEWLDNPDGSWSSEISSTIQNADGSWSVVPGMWLVNGKPQRVDEDTAAQYAKTSGLNFPKYKTLDEAEKFANDREAVWQGVKPEEASKIPALWNSQTQEPTTPQPNDMEFGGMSPAEKAAYGEAQARPNQIDDVNAQAMALMSAQHRADLQRKQLQQKLNAEDFRVRNAVKNPEKLAADIKRHFGEGAVQGMSSLSPADQRKMILIADAAARRDAGKAVPVPTPQQQAQLQARVPGLSKAITTAQENIPAGAGSGNFRMAEDRAMQASGMSQGNVRMYEGAEQQSSREADIIRTEMARQGPGLPPLVNRLRDAGVRNPTGVMNRVQAATSDNPQVSVMASPEQNATELQRFREANRARIQQSAQQISQAEQEGLRAQNKGSLSRVLRVLNPMTFADSSDVHLATGETGPKVAGELSDTFADLLHMVDTGAGTVKGNDYVGAAIDKIRNFGAYMRGRGDIAPQGFGEQLVKSGAGMLSAAEKYELEKGATGLPFWAIMGGEAAVQTQGQPVHVQALKTAENVLFGAALEFGPGVISKSLGKLPGPVGEFARKLPNTIGVATTSTGFGGLAAYQVYKNGGTPAEVIGAGLGAAAGTAALSATAVGKETAGVGVRAENTPEWLRSKLAKYTDVSNVVMHTDDGRAMSVYGDPKSQGIGGEEIPIENVDKYKDVPKVRVTPEQFSELQNIVKSGRVPSTRTEQPLIKGETSDASRQSATQPESPVQPSEPLTTITPEEFRSLIDQHNGDASAASDALTATLQDHLDAGRTVTLNTDGKSIPIVAINRGMMQDAEGKRWGTMNLATGNAQSPAGIQISGGQTNAANTGQQSQSDQQQHQGTSSGQDLRPNQPEVRSGQSEQAGGSDSPELGAREPVQPGGGKQSATSAAEDNAPAVKEPNARPGQTNAPALSSAASDIQYLSDQMKTIGGDASAGPNGTVYLQLSPTTSAQYPDFRSARDEVQRRVDSAPEPKTPALDVADHFKSELVKRGIPAGAAEGTAQVIDTAIQNRDAKGLADVLHTGNKNSRTIFEQYAGVSLGKTEKSTKAAIDDWVRAGGQPASVSTAKAETPKADVSSIFDDAFAGLKAQHEPSAPAKPTGTPQQLREQLATTNKEIQTLRATHPTLTAVAQNDPDLITRHEAQIKAKESHAEAIVNALREASGLKQNPQWREIGKNSDGKMLYEDQHGVRAILHGAARITEPVPLRPTRGGYTPVTPVHGPEFTPVAEAAKTAATEAVSGLADVVRGLGEIFKSGAKGDINPLGPAFDEETYQKAKPFFVEGARHFYKASMSIADVMKALLKYLVDVGRFALDEILSMRPYIERFVEEFRDGKIDLNETVDAGSHEAATSPLNDRAEPSQPQKEAGNYLKGHVRVSGLDISIENAEGSTRSGRDANGKEWSITVKSPYGYIRNTEGKDGEHVDVFIKPGTPLDYQGPVFVVNQTKGNGHFDEHKVMLGFGDEGEAEKAYLANYEKGWDRYKDIATFADMSAFKDWLKNEDQYLPAVTPSGSTDVPSAEDYGTIDSPNVPNLAKWFAARLSRGESYRTISQARGDAGEQLGGKVEPGTQAAKMVDEAVELGVVMAARQIIAEHPNTSEEGIFKSLVDLYNRQPNLGVKTSTSVANQAYSTPVPLAYIASRLAGITDSTTVGEPTAGNGALLIEANERKVVANELNPERNSNLRSLFPNADTIKRVDASEFPLAPAKSLDVVIANPPFGVVKEVGETKRFQVNDRYNTPEIDHAISMKALEAMKDDGSAVLILGGVNATDPEKRSNGYAGKSKLEFYVTLYGEYNVVDHFTVNGDLYKKQGAAWPVDVIVIHGRGKSQRTLPAADVPRMYDSWDELEGVLDEPYRKLLDARRATGEYAEPRSERAPSSRSDQGRAGDVAGSADLSKTPERQAGVDVEPGGRSRGGIEQPIGTTGRSPADRRPGRGVDTAVAGERTGQPSPRSEYPGPAAAETAAQQSSSAETIRRDNARGLDERAPESAIESGPVARTPRPKEKQDVTLTQSPYRSASQAGVKLNTLVPANMKGAIEGALDRLVDRVGDVDNYVANEVGYDPEELGDYFSAEQIDATALAIDNLKRNSGMIIGDQGGIGKGRVIAAVIKWAHKNDKPVIFVTEKPNLYKDIVRDLVDIGYGSVREWAKRAIMTNSDTTVPLDDEGQFELKTSPASHKAKLQELMNEGDLGHHDLILTTYNQMQTVKGARTHRQDFLEQFAPGSIVIFDESHNAGGAEKKDMRSNAAKALGPQLDRSVFARQLINMADGVFYSSATYAKRPQVMDLYSKTDMKLAVAKPSDLAAAIEKGGVPLQQAVAAMLAEAGQYIRRERDFAGMTYETDPIEVNHAQAESTSEVMRAIVVFDLIKQDAVAGMDKEAKAAAKKIIGSSGATGKAGAESTNFTSLMHNLISQMLLMLKADGAVQKALEVLKREEKPVITLASTMGSFIQGYAEDNDLHAGDAIGLSFGDMLRRYLERSRDVRVGKAFGPQERHYLSDDELGPAGLAAYNKVMELIRKANWDGMPVSPIDYIKHRLKSAVRHDGKPGGYSIGEITGRGHVVEYTPRTQIYRTRPARETSIKGRSQTLVDFNNGTHDGLIINQAGSTGLSIHASAKFKDQRKRVMLITQPELNIDTHMQMLYRVDRTGQVVKPGYRQLMADIPAEKRPAAILSKKMASLNANTTAAKGSAYEAKDVPDFMNEYGDEVAASLMEDHPEINKELGRPIKPGKGQGLERDGAVRKLSGRIPLLTEQRQNELYEMIESEYHDLIQRLDAMGENALEAKTLNLDAKLLKKTEVFKGTGDSPFSRGAFAEESDVKRIGKPYTSEQVTKLLSDAVKGNEGDGLAELRFKGRDVSRAQAADTQSRFADYKRGIVDAEEDPGKAKAQEIKLNEQLNRWNDLHQALQLGASVKIDTPLGEVYGIVVKVEQKGKPRNPATPGSWRATFAVADAMRQVTVPFSKIKLPDEAKTAEESMGSSSKYRVAPAQEAMARDKEQGRKVNVPIIKAFDLKQSESREQRVILTGNLLAAFGRFKKGRIINFTDAEGQVRQGIMMPVDFNLEKAIKEEPATFKRARDIMDFLREAPNARIVSTPDSVLRLTYNHGSLKLSTSASKARGGQYFLNEKLLDAANDEFVKSGSNMQMFVGEDRASDVVQSLLDQGVELQTDTYKDEAKRLVARPDTSRDPGQRGSVGIRPARTGYEGPGPASKLSDLSQRIRDAFNVVRGRGPGAPAHQNFSTLGRLGDIWRSGGGFDQLAKFNRPLYEAARRAAGASTTGDLRMRRGAQRVQEIMKTKGGWLKFVAARYHALLQGPHGKRDMWLDMRDQASNLPDEEFKEFYGGGDTYDGVRSLVQIIEGMPFGKEFKIAEGFDPEDSVTGMVDSLLASDDINAARSYLSNIFNAAADDVASILDDDEYQSIINSNEFKKANPVFDEFVGRPMSATHELNEGVFSEYTGPFGYMPLVALDPDGGMLHRMVGLGRRGQEFRKPENQRNRFATGLSPFGYDISPEALAGAISRAERVNTVANMLATGEKEGIFKTLKRGEVAPDTIEYGSESFKAKTVAKGKDRFIFKDGKQIHVPAPRIAMPDFLHKELLPMLEEGDYSRGNFMKLMGAINRFAMMGVIMPAMHIRNIQSALVAATPYVGTNVISKTIGNLPFTKWLNVWANILATNPWSEASLNDIYDMSEMGVVPSRYGKVASGLTYKGRQYAGMTGAKKEYLGLGPLIYGPAGVDIRARLLMYRAAKSFAPNATKTELAHFIDQLGNYNFQMHSHVEKFLKKYGVDPFYTAANTYWTNAIKATFGVTPLPHNGKTVASRIITRMVMLLSGGVAGTVILWIALYKAYTGKWPWKDPRMKYLSIPLNDKDRKHWLAQKVYGSGNNTAYVGLAFLSPLIERGARATGIGPYFDARVSNATKGQASEDAGVSILNSAMHQFVGGPVPGAAWAGVTGKRTYITSSRDLTGREGLSFLPATKTAEPGLPTWKAHALAAATGLNSFFETAAERTGVVDKAMGKQKSVQSPPNPWLRMALDIAAPRLISNPVNLEAKRGRYAKAEKAIESDIRRDKGIPAPSRATSGGGPKGLSGIGGLKKAP